MNNENKYNVSPPRLAIRILRWYCHPDLLDEVEGDLYELFLRRMEEHGLWKAKALYWLNVLMFLHPDYIRKRKKNYPNSHTAMFRNYFKIGWRSLTKHTLYSSIKIGGFALGIAACLLIALFIRQELSYDRYYEHGNRIYRVVRESTFNGETSKGVAFPAPFAEALQEDYPDLEEVGRYNAVEFFGAGSNEVRPLDQTESSHEEGVVFFDQLLLNILEIPFVYGNPKTALVEPNSMVITKRKADKYFPHEDPLGKIFILNNDEHTQYQVTGVIENFPVTSHLQYDFLISLSGRQFYEGEATNWVNDNYPTYVLVRPQTDIAQLEKKLLSSIEKYFLPAAIENGNANAIAWVKSIRLELQPVSEIYLNLENISDGLSHGDIRYVWLFGAIATFILLIASINFINLSTARSANRAKEVGLRKVVGSQRSSLIMQFLSESLLFSFFSFVLGLLIAWLLLPYFNFLMAKTLVFPWNAWWLFPMLLAGTLIVGTLAGLYPSFYLSSFNPVQVLKGNVSRGSKSSSTRNILVIFQFTISLVLIVGTLTIHRQMDYMFTKKLGYDKDQVLLLQGTNTLGDKIATFKNELLRLPEVKYATISSYLPVEGTKRNNNSFWKEGRKNIDRLVSGQRWEVDHDFIKTMGMKIINGRDFSMEMPSDSQALVINQAMTKALNLEDPIGEHITNGWSTWQVIGVVEDFHFESMKQHIGPLCLQLGRSSNIVSIKVNTADMPNTINAVTKVWQDFSPNQPIRYTFLDQSYAKMYDDVKRIGRIFTSFAMLAIMVACLGLFALSAFMVEQRSKEISIRLVLGASLNNILRIITQNFLMLVLISLVIAIPISWYMMRQWLQDYEYRIQISWDVFLLAGLLAVLIAILTISYQSIRAALMNPVDSLRNE